MYIKANTSLMVALNAGDIILTMCTNLHILSTNFRRYDESVRNASLLLPTQHTDAQLVKNVAAVTLADMQILAMALAMNVLDPLTPKKIQQLSQCAMASLYCAVQTAIAASVCSTTSSSALQKSTGATSSGGGGGGAAAAAEQSETDSAEDDRQIVDKALEIFSTVGCIFNYTRSHIYQNHLCAGAWLLVSAIQGGMSGISTSTTTTAAAVTTRSAEDSKGKSPSRDAASSAATTTTTSAGRVNLFRMQQGFGVLNAAIVSHCLKILGELIDDLEIESRSDQTNVDDAMPDPAGFDILGHYSSLQRIVRVLNTATMQQLLTFLATISYRKACTLKRVNIKTDGGEQISYSDSTTYFNDTFSCSEVSESEDEEDIYLGIWFKETLSPELKETPAEEAAANAASAAAAAAAAAKTASENERTNNVAAKDEPHEYLELSAQIFTFLDIVLGSKHSFLSRYVRAGLSEQQMVLLANILKDLDRDAARGEPEMLAGVQWHQAMSKFAGAIGRYLHNLISLGMISETLQSSLLLQLGVSPWAQDTSTWPLQVYSRTLAVLVQILLLKPPQEKEAACLSVWQRLVNTLVEGVCLSSSTAASAAVAAQPTVVVDAAAIPSLTATNTNCDLQYEDLNVEHAQLLLFLFHSLNLMQKKSVLLLTAGGVIRCADVCRGITPEKPLRDHQLVLLSRLLLFLEYMMKHLYNAPTVLLEQVIDKNIWPYHVHLQY